MESINPHPQGGKVADSGKPHGYFEEHRRTVEPKPKGSTGMGQSKQVAQNLHRTGFASRASLLEFAILRSSQFGRGGLGDVARLFGQEHDVRTIRHAGNSTGQR